MESENSKSKITYAEISKMGDAILDRYNGIGKYKNLLIEIISSYSAVYFRATIKSSGGEYTLCDIVQIEKNEKDSLLGDGNTLFQQIAIERMPGELDEFGDRIIFNDKKFSDSTRLVRLPRISDYHFVCNVGHVNKKVGDQINSGEELMDLELIQLTMVLESPNAGTILYLADNGDLVMVGDIVAVLGNDKDDKQALLDAEMAKKSKPNRGQGLLKEAVIQEWYKKAGDQVDCYDDLFVKLKTDQGDMCVRPSFNGKVLYLNGEAGDVIPPYGILAVYCSSQTYDLIEYVKRYDLVCIKIVSGISNEMVQGSIEKIYASGKAMEQNAIGTIIEFKLPWSTENPEINSEALLFIESPQQGSYVCHNYFMLRKIGHVICVTCPLHPPWKLENLAKEINTTTVAYISYMGSQSAIRFDVFEKYLENLIEKENRN